MTFSASLPAVGMVAALALLAVAALLVAEWRRPDERRRWTRLGATFLAVVALASWALRPARLAGENGTPVGQITAALWTDAAGGSCPAPEDVARRYRFALPGTHAPTDGGATFLPDVGTLRRRYPEVGRLLILGDGLDPADLSALGGLRVELVPTSPQPPAAGGPTLRSLHRPRVLTLGETLTVEGRVGDLPAGSVAALTLEAPDGTVTETTTAPANADGEAGFALRGAPPSATGRTMWRLRLKERAGDDARVVADETLGVEIRVPTLPRVLVLESAPRFDTAALRRWYEEAGGTLRARLRLGQDRFRFFAAGPAPPPEFNTLDAALLAGCDLVVADGRALASLPAPERDLLRAAVADTGLGILVLADDAVLPPASVAPDRAWLFPWQWRPLDTAADDGATGGGTEHLARISWPGLARPADVPLPAAPFEIVVQPGQAGAVRDDQRRALAATAALGRGTLALTLVRETGRWQRADLPEAFAGYWSFLFARTARPLASSGRWTLAGGDDGPVFVDEPLDLVLSGAADSTPPTAVRIADDSGAPPVALAPRSDPDEPGRWRVRFWPRRASWHRLEADGATLDFYVDPAGGWPALAAARRRTATGRYAATNVPGRIISTRRAEPTPIPAGWWYGAFLLGAGFLWIERRQAGA